MNEIEMLLEACPPDDAVEAEARARVDRWVEQFDLCRDPAVQASYTATRPVLSMACYYSTATIDALTLVSRPVAWGFLLDDECKSDRPDLARCSERITSAVRVVSGSRSGRTGGHAPSLRRWRLW